MADDARQTVRLPADCAAEMRAESNRTGVPITTMISALWKLGRDHFTKYPGIDAITINVDAIHKSKRK